MRPDDKFMMQMTDMIASRSSCTKIQVGATLVRNEKIVAQGYNGTVPGAENCCDHFKDHPYLLQRDINIATWNDPVLFKSAATPEMKSDFMEQHAKFSEEHEIHAEVNCIASATENGANPRGATMYTTYSPCFGCAKILIRYGVARIVYRHVYKQEAIDYLKKFCIVEQIKGE